MSYEAHKVINKEFEEMINEVCGVNRGIELSKRKGRSRPTPDFYDLPIYHEEFMEWWKEKNEEKYNAKMITKCECGAVHTIYTEPLTVETYNDIGGNAATSWHTQYQSVQHERFFCWRCGKPFTVTGSKISKIKSNQMEVVL
jgi:hypothetical protein